MNFTYNDGGRKAAGYKGRAGDCVVRSIAIATGLPYREVYDAVNVLARRERPGKRGRSKARDGVAKQTYERYLKALGWTWVPTMKIGSGCTVHLNERELPAGRLIVRVSGHMTCVIDGVIHDTYDCSERGATIYPAGTPAEQLPKKAYRLEGGAWAYQPERCVYGYFVKL